LALNEPECESNGKLKTMTTPEKSSKSTGRQSRATTTSRKSTGETSHEWTLSAEDSPASRSVLPGSDEARQMTVTSGLKWSAALTLSGPLGSLARMCLASSTWHSTRCVLIWKVSATKSGRSLYQLAPSMPRTKENGSGLWPTPKANEKIQSPKAHAKGFYSPMERVVMWPTPNARDHKDAGANVNWEKLAKKSKLAGAVMWPTPHANCHTGAGHAAQGGVNTQTAVGGSLNPAWVEWLMGYPKNWTEVG
jgi:hypothetical protein